MNKIVYPQESIEKLLLLLNNIEVKSIDNAKRIVMIENILQTGVFLSDANNIPNDNKKNVEEGE